MGKHTASDEAIVHPLVADALERRHRSGSPASRRSSGSDAPNIVAPQPGGTQSSAVGWPAASGRGEGLGWPVDPQPEAVLDVHPDDDGSLLAVLDEAAAVEAAPAAEERAPVRRSGWRRFFGGGHGSDTRSTSAA